MRQRWVLKVLCFIIGFALAWFLKSAPTQSMTTRGKIMRTTSSEFPLISSILACDVADEKDFQEFAPIKSMIQQAVESAVNRGAAEVASVYFRTLNSGRWVNVNGDKKFSPASMLKVPVMIAYFKLAETHPEVLAEHLRFTGGNDRNAGEAIKSGRHVDAGKTYTIAELIDVMITASDNNAQYLLEQNLDVSALKEIYSDFHLSIPTSTQADDFMSGKDYALILRVLYGATYLNGEYSNKALDLLSKTEFQDGIVAGVPDGTTVAHKFGERSVVNENGIVQSRELHDCGIVYYPGHPYLLCVMTRGKDFPALKQTIQDISRQTYASVAERFTTSSTSSR